MTAVNTKKFIVDASFVLCFLLPDEGIDKVTKTFQDFKDEKIKLISTTLLPFEVFNALRSAINSKRITYDTGQELVNNFFKYEIDLVEIDFKKTLKQSLENKISFYDACYLQLANMLDIPLLTLDKPLAKLAR